MDKEIDPKLLENSKKAIKIFGTKEDKELLNSSNKKKDDERDER